MTLLRELIDIPERVYRGDFVLRLTEGVTRPKETLRDYVVTPQLSRCFDDALAFIRSALDGRSSKASYLHGSFGAGKSHFMAILLLLLHHDQDVRSVPALVPVIAKHAAWLNGKRFLLVPYHMIGAHSMESAVLGGYVDHVMRLHPKAPHPGLYLAERIFEDAQAMRARMDDGAFFDALNAGKDSGGGWGAIGARWDAASFERAIRAPAGSEDRTRLVGDMVAQLFRAYRDVAAAGGDAFVPLDEGLSIVSKHAKALGYDAVILFLDELVLWLASHVGDTAFLNREGQKLAKLVEAATADRPIPLVSFVARQRDLRELVGEHVPGAERLGFADVLKWWESRFDKITLEDRNLPAIAGQRLLRPRDEAARHRIDQAFEESTRVREDVMNVLLTSGADRAMFRSVYPFSPALVQTLVAVSSALQRERTALKVMLQLLVDQRDELELGQVVPVGDLFDAIAEGDEPFTEDMRHYFENARRLYYQKLLPMIEREHGLRLEEVRALPPTDARRRAFRAHDRIVKTLLLAALVPEVESLKGMTASRLAALNHGTIRAPIPGAEARTVLAKCREWAAQVGELRVGEDEPNPTITIQLSGVDTQSIIERARGVDNLGNRRMAIRDLLAAQFSMRTEDRLFQRYEFPWRGTRRAVEILFASIREQGDDALSPTGSDWKVIIGFPFEPGHSGADDIARIDEFRTFGKQARTLCWAPAYLTGESLKDLGTFVILEHILTGERFASFASHLSQVDQATARGLLENQRSQLRQRLRACLEGAYGVAPAPPGSVETLPEASDRIQSLDPGLQPRPPVGANLGAAFQHLLDQLLAHQYPAHPRFEIDIRPAVLRRIWEVVQRAIQASNNRVVVERERRQEMRQIANPLELGEMHEDAFILGQRWRQHFHRKAAETGERLMVPRLRAWTDEPVPAGLTREVQNLLIMTFAEQTSHSFVRHGGPFTPTIESIPDEVELRPQRVPAQAEWDAAVDRLGKVLGVAASPLPSAGALAQAAAAAQAVATKHRTECSDLVSRLRPCMERFGVDGPTTSRFRTATAMQAFVETVLAASPDDLIGAVARATIDTSLETMALSMTKAERVVTALAGARLELLDSIARLTDERQAAATAIRDRFVDALAKDELAVGLEGALRQAEIEAARLLAAMPVPAGTPPSPPPPGRPAVPAGPSPRPVPGWRVVEQASASAAGPDEAKKLLADLTAKLALKKGRRLSVDWRIEEPEA